MSLVIIENEKNPIELHNMINDAVKTNSFTPEFCMNVLGCTNVSIIMIEMLQEIEKMPVEEQIKYKDVILSMFDGRQTNEKVRTKAFSLAQSNRFEKELSEVVENTGNEGYSNKVGNDKIYIIKSGDYSMIDFSSYKGIMIGKKNSDYISFYYFCDTYNPCDRQNDTLNGIIDMQGCNKVCFSKCNLIRVKEIKLSDGAQVIFSKARNLPLNLDISMCEYVDFYRCDLEGIKLKFRDNSRIYLNSVISLPTDLDVSMCKEIGLCGLNLKYCNLKFKKGAIVSMISAKSLPEKLDVSMCGGVKMTGANVSNVKELKFKNKRQMEDSEIKIPEGWTGKIIYEEEDKKVSTWNRIKGIFSKGR